MSIRSRRQKVAAMEPAERTASAWIAHTMKIDRPLLFGIIADALSIVVSLLIFGALPRLTLIPCTYPLAQSLTLALCAASLIHLFALYRFRLAGARPFIVAYSLCLFLVLWLGSYPFSPLGFSSGRIPVLNGFMVSRSGRPPISVASRQIVTIAATSITEIQPVTLPVEQTAPGSRQMAGLWMIPGVVT